MVADHLAKAAEIGADAGLDESRARTSSATARTRRSRRRATSPPSLYSNQEALTHYKAALKPRRRRRRLRPPRRAGAHRREVRRRRAPPGPRRQGGRAVGALPRVPPRRGEPGAGRRPPPQDRRGPLEQGRPRGLDQPLPARHRPAEGRAAVPRARAPLRGGRLALHAHRRQHARDLRLGEGASPGRAPRGSGRGQPRARHLRPRLRPHRRHGARAREPRALGRAGARLRPRRGDPRAPGAGLPLRDLRGRLRRGDGGLQRGARDRRADRRPAFAGRAPLLALAPGLPSRQVGRGRGRHRDGRCAGRARGPDRQALLPAPPARRAALARLRTSRAPSARCAAPPRWPRRSGRSEIALPGAPRPGGDASRPASTTRTPTASSPPRSTRASGRAWSRSRSRPPPHARSTQTLWGRADQATSLADEATGLAERLRYPVGSAAALEARGFAAGDAAAPRARPRTPGANWAARSKPSASPAWPKPPDTLRPSPFAEPAGAYGRPGKPCSRGLMKNQAHQAAGAEIPTMHAPPGEGCRAVLDNGRKDGRRMSYGHGPSRSPVLDGLCYEYSLTSCSILISQKKLPLPTRSLAILFIGARVGAPRRSSMPADDADAGDLGGGYVFPLPRSTSTGRIRRRPRPRRPGPLAKCGRKLVAANDGQIQRVRDGRQRLRQHRRARRSRGPAWTSSTRT